MIMDLTHSPINKIKIIDICFGGEGELTLT